MVQYTVDTNIIGLAARGDMDAAYLLIHIKRKNCQVVFDNSNKIYDEYERCIHRAEMNRLAGSELMRNWLKHIVNYSTWINGNLTNRQQESLTRLGFDPTDWKFVATCAYSQDKALVAQESDYCEEVNTYLNEELKIFVMNIEQSIQHIESI
jgi:hypothetical protein